MGTRGTNIWAALASMSPFETLRKYLVFSHRKDQDRRFREAAEARKLDLENEARELAIIEKRIKLAKQLGASQSDLLAVYRRVVEPTPEHAMEKPYHLREPRLLGPARPAHRTHRFAYDNSEPTVLDDDTKLD